MRSPRFAYPVSIVPTAHDLVEVACRDLPELRLVLPAMSDQQRLLVAVQAVLDLVVTQYLQERRQWPPPSQAQPGEHVLAPSVAVIEQVAKLLATRCPTGESAQ